MDEFAYEGWDVIERAWREGLTPDPLLTVSEWADRHRVLSSKASSEPGRWRTSRTPYLKAIMDCLSPTSPVERVVFMKGAQVGATETGSNWIGYVIHHAPGPMMAVWPTVEMAKRNSKQRIDPLIEESPVLCELIAPARSRDSGNTILAKEFRGGVLVMTGANSAVGLRSMPVRYLFLDEVDGYPLDVEGEGDAISLAEARTRTFARRKIFIVSTPTIAGASAIEREYEASDQRRYFVPCPHCSHRQWLRFEQLRWEKGRPETAAYVCESCETAIAEHHKTWMLEHGEWRATAEGSGKTAGFHLSSLYSPLGWRAWCEIAAAWEAAVSKESGSAAAIKTFKNTELGETWVEEGEAPDWQRLLERREDYAIGTIPAGGLLLTAGADVQKDRIEVSVWAFGRGKEAWLIEHRVLMGDTARDAVWKALGGMLAETWTHASGAAMPLARLALDTGFATQEAYAFVRACRDARVMAVKGVRTGSMGGAALIGTPTAVDVSQAGKKLRRGIKVYSVAVGIAKLELYNNLRKSADVAEDGSTPVYPAGFVHLPKIDAEFIQQLCAEQLITRRDRNGFPVREWQKVRERNEALDCYVYARAAAAAAGLDRFEERHWRELERQLGLASPPALETPTESITEATHRGGLGVSGNRNTGRRVIKSRWLS
ncbi:phage terminase large subunit family protein [Gulbenkiania mobilis]|uniref:phage terminase large subunit family protein n=1 Tax=Gulbenkiania mobilis TaxID=397457 RepID=UPI0006BBE112|nr:phage terminase large subunit family protein [Gulbenkiania mobilis]